MDKGALQAKKKAHVETETDKVTRSRVALTERESESLLVITVFTFLLSCFIPLSTQRFFCLPPSWFLLVFVVTSAMSNWNANELWRFRSRARLFSNLAFLLVGHCASFRSQPDCSLQTSLPSSSSYWVCHAGWPFPPCQSSLSSESGAAYCWNKEVQRRLLRKGSAICLDPNSHPTENLIK